MQFDYFAPRNVQELTCSAVLLLSPFLNASLNPAMNYPYTGLGEPYTLPESLYTFAAPFDRERKELNALEQFAANLIGRTRDLDFGVAKALNDDFWLLYES